MVLRKDQTPHPSPLPIRCGEGVCAPHLSTREDSRSGGNFRLRLIGGDGQHGESGALYGTMSQVLNVEPQSPMSAVLERFPGAQRALFRRYHIGGCSSCGFQPTETLAQVCARNGDLDVAEVLAHIESSHEQDEKILISPKELAAWLKEEPSVQLVDIRSREEFEAVHIPGSVLLSQDVMRGLMGSGSDKHPIVIVDHLGKNGLDATAYFLGHGLRNVRCLRGGIDAWAQDVDPALRRYRVG